jgi:isopenicillin N synthase-like dioxygenase
MAPKKHRLASDRPTEKVSFVFFSRTMASLITTSTNNKIPVIDISPFFRENVTEEELNLVATSIGNACRTVGFFCVVNHGIPHQLMDDMQAVAKKFFNQPSETKSKVSMKLGGKAWRGWFPVGDELTSGRPDQKEGYYFGSEEDSDHPLPLHGSNIWPNEEVPEMKDLVLEYMDKCTQVAQKLMQSICRSLNVDVNLLKDQFEKPTTLFRIFNYPPHPDCAPDGLPLYGVAEHTDYGYLTLLYQDQSGGLQARLIDGEWIEVPPIPYSLVVNLGDALQHNTGGLLRATPHRVRHLSTQDRLSFPFFFDPGFESEMINIIDHLEEDSKLKKEALLNMQVDKRERWDGANPEQFQGKYGVYLMKKVSKVFPELSQQYIAASS